MERIDFNSIDSLKKSGFEGFKSVAELMKDNASVPKQKGVYMIVRKGNTSPSFLEEGTGGFFKGKNPNVTMSELKKEWVNETIVVYIGKAGGGNSDATLHSRLKQYMRFGDGDNVGHWGGRYIWQLADSRDLLVCWKPIDKDEPVEVESRLIAEFKSQYKGKRPFANLRD